MIFVNWKVPTNVRCGSANCFRFPEGLAEAQRGEVTYSGSHSYHVRTLPGEWQWELALVTFFHRLVWRGYRRTLGPEDLWSLSRENSSEELVSQLEREWTRNRSAAQR